MKERLSHAVLSKGLAQSTSQAEDFVKLGFVVVNKKQVTESDYLVNDQDRIELNIPQSYVSRAGLKLSSVAKLLRLDFRDKVVLDVGSSTGGFTDYALQNGADKVIAVELGSKQLHPKLRTNQKIELHEQTDIRNISKLSSAVDIILVDVSFISLREILPKLKEFCTPTTIIVAMLKPQFEANEAQKNHGVIKNDKIRRDLIHNFETWIRENSFFIIDQADSAIHGTKGNRERFYTIKNVKSQEA